MGPAKLPISLVIITLNEEKNIERCIRSAPFVSEVLVLDSGSTDKTCDIARSLGAKVVHAPWPGYRAQKQKGTDMAANDWVLSLDADEALSQELAAEIQSLFQSHEPSSAAFEVARRSFYLGRWINHGGWYPDYQIRLFHRKNAQWSEGNVHERIASHHSARLHKDLHHYPFGNLQKQIDTNNEYSSLASRDLAERQVRFSLFKLLVKPTFKFLECYVWKRGFLDGLPGFVIAVGAAYSMFLKWAKLWEKQKVQK